MVFPILVRRHLYIESGPWLLGKDNRASWRNKGATVLGVTMDRTATTLWSIPYIVPRAWAEIAWRLAVPSTCLQGAWYARSLQSKYAAAASFASRVRWRHRACTLEAQLSRSRLALNLHLPATQAVPATHVGGAPPCAARTCVLRSHRRRSARSIYCTLFNNRCVLSACSLRLSKHAPATCVGGTVLCVSATESDADPPQRGAQRVVTEA